MNNKQKQGPHDSPRQWESQPKKSHGISSCERSYDFAPFFSLSFHMILDIVNEISLEKVQKKIGMYVTTETLHLNLSFP